MRRTESFRGFFPGLLPALILMFESIQFPVKAAQRLQLLVCTDCLQDDLFSPRESGRRASLRTALAVRVESPASGRAPLRLNMSDTPQVRIYLLCENRPPVAGLSRALPEYDAIVARAEGEVAFVRKIPMESEEQFRVECQRAANILALQVRADGYLSCVYDDDRGRTRFLIEFRKTGSSQDFIADAASGLD